MAGRWAGLRRDVALLLGVAIGLMSGIAALIREWLTIFYPNAVNSGRLFNAFLITCFFSASLFVFYRQRLTIASLEATVNDRRAGRERLQNARLEFARHMQEGEQLAIEWRQGMREYGHWLQRRREWIERVSDFLTNMGLPDEAAAFRRAGEGDPDINQLHGPNQNLYWLRFYGGQLDRWRDKLAEISARLLAFRV